MKVRGLLMLALLLLGGCNSANLKPPGAKSATDVPGKAESSAGTKRSNDGKAPAEAAQKSAASAAKPSTAVSAADIGQLADRLTLVQEQLIELKSQSAALSRNSELLLARLQMLTQQDSGAASADGAPPAENRTASGAIASEKLNGLIDRFGMIANQLSVSAGGDPYRVAADYTRSGQWVLIRYNRFSGKTWLADQGSWQPLVDPVDLPASEYSIVIERADQDVKGYVAARLDRQSGDTWWLKQDTWQKFD